jgi:pimeloyl-ACP methyl ester carboxylesterase
MPETTRTAVRVRPSTITITKILLTLAVAAVTCVVVSEAQATAQGTDRPASVSPTIVVGAQTLKACGKNPLQYCGRLAVPLDYGDPAGPKIEIAYSWYPAQSPTGGKAEGTVLPVEGGPGFPSVGSVQWGNGTVLGEGGYYYMYGRLLRDWNMLAVDLRGTGSSTPLDCPSLQNYSDEASGPRFTAVVGSCANELNHRWRYSDGDYIHASDMFTSVPAAEDLAAVVRALGIRKIDLYGDSYGSFFAQVFANHYPELIRSVILDSTYQTQNLGPWYRSTIDSMPADFDLACSRSPACAKAAGRPAWDDVEALTARLRKAPISGVVPGPNGNLVEAKMGVVGLVNLLNDAAGDPMIYRGIDAAARALLFENDKAPLLRLYAQRLAEDEDYFDMPASDYSDLLYMAVSCLDYPQLFSMNKDEATREAELRRSEERLPASSFAPFTTAEWLAQDQNTEDYTACVAWPSPIDAQEPPTVGHPILPKSMPVLVLGGEFDTWTPPAGVSTVMAELGGDSRFIELANSTHVVGEGDQECGSELVQEFVNAPRSIKSMNASCAPKVPAIASVGVYPASLSGEPPLHATRGNTGSTVELRLGAAVVETAGDALARLLSVEGNHDKGLYGGTALATKGGRVNTLTDDVLVPGVSLSGVLDVTASTASGTFTVVSAQGTSKFEIEWPLQGSGMATVRGTCGAEHVAGVTYPPLQTF